MGNDWEKVQALVKELPQIIEGLDLEAMEDGSIKIADAQTAARKLTEKLAGLRTIKNRGDYHPDLDKIPTIEEALRSLERIPGVLPVREVTDLRCRIEAAEGRFDVFNHLLEEAENTGPVREVGKLVEFDRTDGTKGARVDFFPEVKMPRGIPPKVWQAQVRAYDPQTKETAVYFPRDWRNEDHFAVAKALRDLYERAREGHREFKAEKDAQWKAERPYFEQSTLEDLTKALVDGKDGIIAFGFNYQEQFSDKPAVRGVPVVKFEAGKLSVIDLTPSFEGIEGLEKGVEYPFTAGEKPDLRGVPRTLRFMLFKVLDAIRKKAGGAETGQGKTGRKEETPPPLETKPPRRKQAKKIQPEDRAEEPKPKVSRTPKTRGSRAGAKAALRDAAGTGEEPES